MRYIGLLCNCSIERNPREELSPSLINRAFLIDRLVRPAGSAVFLYSPREVCGLTEVPGYIIDGNELRGSRQAVPRVNANWTYGTRRLINQGMGYTNFKRWTAENGVGIYVPYAFAELVSNKAKAYRAVRQYDAALHPHTEDHVGTLAQVSSFLDRSGIVFIKPRSGNRGNRILVLRQEQGGCSLKYYDQGTHTLFSPVTLEAALGVIQGAVGGRSYVIQDGIESLRLNGSVFDVRVVMVNDGSRWHSIFETRLSPRGSDLTNIFQGGSIEMTESLLTELLGSTAAGELMEEIRRVSHGLATHLESFFPGDLMEMGFDFVLDRDRKLHLVEVNSKPGVAGFGSETTLFDWKPEDELNYERWVRPHVTGLAAFLQAKAANVPLSGT